MFSSALKSFSSNISSNYTIHTEPSSTSGPWKIYDAKRKSTGKAASVFIFDRKNLDSASSGFGGRSSSSGSKRSHDGVIERLKKEASSLARLRHPSILELVEPVEETRSGGLIFATEPVTASLAWLLNEKDRQEKAGGVAGRPSRYVIEDAEGQGRRRREVEIDELEIQKGLLQVAKGLEFLHESARLVHGNLTPEAIFVNAKSDWKISGLGFCSPADENSGNGSVTPISLSEVLHHDARLPRSVQLDIDYTSPDFVMDSNMNTLADMFSLGLVIIALYNSPHRSPLETSQSLSQYKKIFSSSSSVPSRNNNFLSSQAIPKDMANDLLPRLITRRPAQRVDSREFQQAKCFDNILVSTIRFLDNLPAKSHQEKAQFMRGAPRILPQFPKSVLEKKILPVLLDTMKDRDLLTSTLQNVFQVIKLIPTSRRAFSEMVVPHLRETFLTPAGKGAQPDRDSYKEGGMAVLLENISLVAENCSGKEFKDDILPIIMISLESPTHSLVVASLQTLPVVLPVLDFSTIKNELFPMVGTVFSKTSSMAIKIKGLEALKVLCGGSADSQNPNDDTFDAMKPAPKANSSSVLDKYTMQEKIVPLIRAIKTKEPAVMMAALGVFEQIGQVADIEFMASDVLPSLWQFALGPLLNLGQFQAYMTLIKTLSARIEKEQIRKLQETGNSGLSNGRTSTPSFGQRDTSANDDDFENLVSGRKAQNGEASLEGGWDDVLPARPVAHQTASTPKFGWSSSGTSLQAPVSNISRTVSPDYNLRNLPTLNPSASSTTTTSQSTFSSLSPPIQPIRSSHTLSSSTTTQTNTLNPSKPSQVDWTFAAAGSNPWSSPSSTAGFSMGSSTGMGMGTNYNGNSSTGGISIPPPPLASPLSSQTQGNSVWGSQPSQGLIGSTNQSQTKKSGLDKYESLL